MIERKFIKEKLNDHKIQQFLLKNFERSSYSHATIQKTPLGDKIVIYSAKPGMIVGRGGSNLKALNEKLKEMGMQSPQVDVQEISNAMLNPSIVAERVVEMFLKMGTGRFKFIGHNICQKVIDAGAIGVQVTLAGRIPAARAKMWKFIMGFLPKCGSIAYTQVDESFRVAKLKTGAIGVRVKILPPNIRMPDDIILLEEAKVEEMPIEIKGKKEEELITAMEKENESSQKKEFNEMDKKEKLAEIAKKAKKIREGMKEEKDADLAKKIKENAPEEQQSKNEKIQGQKESNEKNDSGDKK